MSGRANGRGEEELAYELLGCVEMGNTKRAKVAIARGASVNGSSIMEELPLHLACFIRQHSMAAFLIEQGADVDLGIHCREMGATGQHAVFVEGWRPLHFAAAKRFVGITRLLVQAGASVNATDIFGCTPLMTACVGQGDIDERATRVAIALELLNAGADASKVNAFGVSTLHEAARKGDDMDLIDLLLSRAPAILNRTDVSGRTPLQIAAHCGNNDAVRHLLGAGATQPRSPYSTATCPLYAAALGGHDDAVRTLLERGMGAIGGSRLTVASAMFVAAAKGHAVILYSLLAAGGQTLESWGTVLGRNASMLHAAAAVADPATIGVILAAGADELALDHRGRRAEHFLRLCEVDRKEDEAKRDACFRVLLRGPAFRALSWAWSPIEAGADARGAGVARVPRPPLGVRLFRPKTNKFLVRLIGRWAVVRSRNAPIIVCRSMCPPPYDP